MKVEKERASKMIATWTVGSELQFTTSFPVDPVPCRKVGFRLYETPTFEISLLETVVTLRPFAW